MKQAAIVLFTAALVFAALAAGLLASRPPDQTARVAELELKLKQAEDEIAYLKAQALEAAKARTTVTRATPDQPPENSTPADPSPAQSGQRGPANLPESMTKMFQDPKMRETMKAQQMIQIEMQYAKLIGKLQLDDKEDAHFKQLLSDRLTDRTELSFQMMDKTLTPAQRKAASDAYEARKATSDEAIRTFLNDDTDYATFQHWEDTEQERMQLVMGRSAFEGAGVPLTQQQEEQLIDLMAQVRKQPSDIPNWTDPRSLDPAKMASDFLPKLMAQLKAQHQTVRNGAASFLTPDQLAALAKMQEQILTMTEAGMKMSRAMMGVEK